MWACIYYSACVEVRGQLAELAVPSSHLAESGSLLFPSTTLCLSYDLVGMLAL